MGNRERDRERDVPAMSKALKAVGRTFSGQQRSTESTAQQFKVNKESAAKVERPLKKPDWVNNSAYAFE